MKKIITLCLLIFSVISYAQVKPIFKAGANFSSISIKGSSSSLKTGIHVGGGIEISLTNKIGIMPELLYSQKGGIDKANNTSTTTSPEVKTSLNYFSIPILFYFKPIENLNLHIGPELSFLLSAKASSANSSADIKKFYESFDKGIAVGANYYFKNLGVGLRYVKGFNGITELIFTDNLGNDISIEKTGANNTIQASIIYKLR